MLKAQPSLVRLAHFYTRFSALESVNGWAKAKSRCDSLRLLNPSFVSQCGDGRIGAKKANTATPLSLTTTTGEDEHQNKTSFVRTLQWWVACGRALKIILSFGRRFTQSLSVDEYTGCPQSLFIKKKYIYCIWWRDISNQISFAHSVMIGWMVHQVDVCYSNERNKRG